MAATRDATDRLETGRGGVMLPGLLMSTLAIVWLALADPKRRRVSDLPPLGTIDRRMVVTVALAPGLMLAATAQWAALCIWLGGCAIVGWCAAAIFAARRPAR